MSDQRRFQRGSGRLPSTPIVDFWQASRTVQDPEIPNLPLETPAAAGTSAWEQGSLAARSFFRRDATRRQLREAPDVVVSAPPAENTDRRAGVAFQTRTTNSRRRLTPAWSAAYAPAGQVAVVPAAAWFTAPRARRRTIEREMQAPEPLQWNRIAPTVAAILKPARPKVVAFDRTLRRPLEQPVYPATPSTGPPLTAWLAAARRTVSQRRRIQRLADQPVYPATPVPEVTDRSAGAAFETRITRGRRRIKPADVIGVGPAAPAVIPYLDAPKAIRRRETQRLLLTAKQPPATPQTPAAPTAQGFPGWLLIGKHRADPTQRTVQRTEQPSYPAPAAPAPVTFAALVQPPRRRRKGRAGLFLTAGDSALSIPTPSNTPAVYPSYLLTGYNRRRETTRRLVPVLHAPVFPVTPVIEVTDRAAGASFETRFTRGRKRLVAPPLLGVAAAPPPEPSVSDITAVTRTRLLRRRGRQGLFLTANTGALSIPQGTTPSVYPSFVPTGYLLRRETDRRLLLPPPVVGVDPAEPPGTSQAPITAVVAARSIRRRARQGLLLGGTASVDGFTAAQPQPAWRIREAIRRLETRRTLREPLALLDRPQTPPVPEQPPTAYRLAQAFRAAGLSRRLQPAAPQLEHPETPPVVVPPVLGGDDKPDARKHPGWDRKRSELKRSEEKRLESSIREVYRKLEGKPETAAKAAELLAALPADPVVASSDLIEALAQRSAKLDTAAVDIEIALRMLLAEVERQRKEDDDLALTLILSLI